MSKSAGDRPEPESEPPLPSLPIEVIRIILSRLSIFSQGTLASCALVSKQFNQIATPLLWRWLRINWSFSLGDGDNTTLDISTWNQDLQDMVQVLDMTIHGGGWCESAKVKSSNLPNIKTLRLTFNTGFTGEREIHSLERLMGKPSCRLIQELKPKTIIICQELQDTHPGFFLDPENFCSTIWSQVETLIYLVPPIEIRSRYMCHDDRDFSRLLPNLKKFIWVFDPTNADLDLEDQGESLEGSEFHLISNILIQNPQIKLTVVNVGCTQLRLSRECRMSYANTEYCSSELFTEIYWDVVDSSSFSGVNQDGTKKMNSPYYLTLEEFMEQEEWYEWFDPQEVMEWRRVNAEIEGNIPTEEDVDWNDFTDTVDRKVQIQKSDENSGRTTSSKGWEI